MKINKDSVFEIYLDSIDSEYDEEENRYKNLTIKRKIISFNVIGMELLAKYGFIEDFIKGSNQLYNFVGEDGPESIFGLDLVGCNSSDKENYSKQIRETFVSYLNYLLPVMKDEMDSIFQSSEEMENMILDFAKSMSQLIDGTLDPDVKAIDLSYEVFKIPFNKYASDDMKEAMDKFYSSLN